MALWDWIETKFLPLFGEITPYSLERVKDIFWITLGACTVFTIVYLPFRAMLAIIKKTKWGSKWIF